MRAISSPKSRNDLLLHDLRLFLVLPMGEYLTQTHEDSFWSSKKRDHLVANKEKAGRADQLHRKSICAAGKPLLRRGRFIDTWVCKNPAWACAAVRSAPIVPPVDFHPVAV
jgi:hypothetical protein